MPHSKLLDSVNRNIIDIQSRVDQTKKLIQRQARAGMENEELLQNLKASQAALDQKVRERNSIIVAIRKGQPLR
jgi:ABC-type transporter Mla subunit MlaD